eukprot:scaffold20401_cov54-Phaeocystis_antarctica.AAC.1
MKYSALVSRVSDHRALDSYDRPLRRPAPGWRPHFGDGVRAPWSYNTSFRYDSFLSTASSRDS